MSDTGHQPEHDSAAESLTHTARPAGLDAPGSAALRAFTLHVGFLAADQRCARRQARAYVAALNQLRAEVDCYTAEISPGEHTLTSRVFCGCPATELPGADPLEVCVDIAGHPGDHRWPGGYSRRG